MKDKNYDILDDNLSKVTEGVKNQPNFITKVDIGIQDNVQLKNEINELAEKKSCKKFKKLEKIASEEFGIKIKKVKKEEPLTFESLFGIAENEINELAKIIDVHLIMNEAENKVNAFDIAKDIVNNGYGKVIDYQECIENLSMDNTILDSQLKEKSEWHYIQYNDLPVEDTVVWCYDGNGYFYCSYRNGDFLTQSADGKWVNVAIIAWIELPQYNGE